MHAALCHDACGHGEHAALPRTASSIRCSSSPCRCRNCRMPATAGSASSARALSRCVSATTARATARRRSRGYAACWPPKASPRPTAKWCCKPFRAFFGFVFNPVSFWFCHDRDGALRAVLAEVRNTFGDHHNYLVAHADQRPITAADTLTARKIFHVSPFFPVAGEYRFRFDLGAGAPPRRARLLARWRARAGHLAARRAAHPRRRPPRAARCCASRC
jgi:hypothetical protein